jgi:uncharacterized radical SAM superfamily protein
MDYLDFVAKLKPAHGSLAIEIEGFSNLENVLNWLKRRDFDLARLDLVTQDEFCHDLIIPIDGKSLVFGMT